MSVANLLRYENPVLIKEMRVRMRGARAYWIIFVFLGFLSLVLELTFLAWSHSVEAVGTGSSDVARLGSMLFDWLFIAQAFLVLFITPGITSGSITIEKEQRTLEMLSMTRLSRSGIVAGKLISAILFTALLLFSSLPLVSICFMLGSVDPAMLASRYILLLACTVMVGSAGIMWSSIARSTTAAVLFTYLSIVLPVLVALGTFGILLSTPSGAVNAGPFADSLFGTSFLGLTVPAGFGAGALSILLGVLFAGIAASRLETWPERSAPFLRGMTTLLISLFALNLDLHWVSAWSGRAAAATAAAISPPLNGFAAALGLVFLIVPIFATGEILPAEARKFGPYLASGWTLRGLRQAKPASGIAYLLGLTLLLTLLYAGAAWRIGGPGGAAGSAKAVEEALAPAAMTALASVGGFGLYCLAVSAIVRNRWVALAAVYCTMGVACALVMNANIYARGDRPGIMANLIYLSPSRSIALLAEPESPVTTSTAPGLPQIPPLKLLYDGTPDYQVTAFAWLTIGVLSLAVSAAAAQRQARGSKPAPFEEAVTSI